MSRPVLLLLPLYLLLSTASLPAAAEQAGNTADERPYIQTSYLQAPRQAGGFSLQASSYDPANKYAGAGFRYTSDDHPGLRIDLYVYPAGRMTPAEALQVGMRDLRASMAHAQAQGSYSQLRELGEATFALPAGPTAGTAPANDFDARVIATIAAIEQVEGRKLQLQLSLPPRELPMHSNAYLFYKQLYWLKLRASAAQQDIDQDRFNALADRAARELVPALQVAHVGSCASAQINVPADAPDEEAALELVRQITVHQSLNCHQDAGKAVSAQQRLDHDIVEITFSAQDWKSQ
ncbi:MAG: hypothetical protein ACI4NW_04055 [Stenotrophomonas sp.]